MLCLAAPLRHRAPVVSLALAVALASLPAALPAQPSLSTGRIAAQVATGAIGTPVGFFATGALVDWLFERTGRDDATTSRLAHAAGWTGAALATAAGPALVGARGPGSGRYPAAVAGAVVGGLASWGLVRLVDRDGPDDERPPRGGRVGAAVAGVATFLLPSIGATLGYDLSRRAR